MLVLGVLTWVNVWNDFLWPLLMIQRNAHPWPGRLRGMRRPVAGADGGVDALMLVPLVILFMRSHNVPLCA